MTNATTKVRAGDVVHALTDFSIPTNDSGLPGSVRFVDRGQAVVLTDAMIQGTRDRNGDTWLDTIDDEDEQTRRWGKPRFGRGAFPQDERVSTHGSAEWAEERARARAHAAAEPDPDRRAALFEAAHQKFDLDRPWAAKNSTFYGTREERAEQESSDGDRR